MNTRLKYRFAVARFMPNQMRGEFINIGILIHLIDTGELLSRWLPKLGRMQSLSSFVTTEEYNHFRSYIKASYDDNTLKAAYTKANPELLDYLHREWSVPFQFSEAVGGFTSDPNKQLDHLYQQIVEPKSEPNRIAKSNQITPDKVRRNIKKQLKQFDLIGQDKILPDIEVPGKTRTWPFDFGKVNGSATLLQVVSLAQKDPIMKSEVAFKFIGYIKDIRDSRDYRQTNAYAIIGNSDDPEYRDGIDEARNLLENAQITTLT